MSFAGYDDWKCTPPEPREDPPDLDEDEPVVCASCLTKTLPDFYDEAKGRCDLCDAPVEEVQLPLKERLENAYQAAKKRGDILAMKKISMWCSRVADIETGLREFEDGR